MNSVFCAAALLLLQDPENWTECVLGHQSSKNLCVCQKPNPALYKCFRKQLCQVNATLAKLELDPQKKPFRLEPLFSTPAFSYRTLYVSLQQLYPEVTTTTTTPALKPALPANGPSALPVDEADDNSERAWKAPFESPSSDSAASSWQLSTFPPPPAVSFFTTEKQVSSLTVYKTKRFISSEGGQKMFFTRLTIFLFLTDHRRQLQHGRRSAGTCRSSNRIDATQTTFSKGPDRTPTSLRQIGPQPGIGSLDPLLSLRRQLAGPRGRQPRGKGKVIFVFCCSKRPVGIG